MLYSFGVLDQLIFVANHRIRNFKMSVKVVDNDSSFQTELGSAGSKLVVVDFYAVW